jgi:ABC-type amino acid transport substrate-binding protein
MPDAWKPWQLVRRTASNDLINLMLMQKDSDEPERFKIIDIGHRFDPKPYGIDVKKGSRSLVDLLNKVIESLKANGDIDRMLDENIARVRGSTEP